MLEFSHQNEMPRPESPLYDPPRGVGIYRHCLFATVWSCSPYFQRLELYLVGNKEPSWPNPSALPKPLEPHRFDSRDVPVHCRLHKPGWCRREKRPKNESRSHQFECRLPAKEPCGSGLDTILLRLYLSWIYWPRRIDPKREIYVTQGHCLEYSAWSI